MRDELSMLGWVSTSSYSVSYAVQVPWYMVLAGLAVGGCVVVGIVVGVIVRARRGDPPR